MPSRPFLRALARIFGGGEAFWGRPPRSFGERAMAFVFPAIAPGDMPLMGEGFTQEQDRGALSPHGEHRAGDRRRPRHLADLSRLAASLGRVVRSPGCPAPASGGGGASRHRRGAQRGLGRRTAARAERRSQNLEDVVEQVGPGAASLIGLKPRISAYQMTARSFSTEPRWTAPAWTRRPASSPR